ncbi:MAG: hypothetical protein VKK04_24205 [Synechococcales bacterium]|nr:hypothetical protein [Synechococcales bacterium]
MPFNVALLDLVSPYLVRGENLGANHAALSVIRVASFELAASPFGMVIRGVCEFNGRAQIDVASGRLDVLAEVDEAEPPFDPNRRSPVFDLRETSLDFELFVPRTGSSVIESGVSSISDDAFTPVRDVLNVWDTPPLDTPLSDFPSSAFVLDLILNAPSVRPPFLHPAQMTAAGLLIPDGSVQEVAITLPKLRFRFSHGNALGSTLRFELVSAGVAGLDDPGDIGVAELIAMEPPYAFVGGAQDRTIGFGFRKAVLDLSEGATPPAVMEKFGFGDDWGGLYLPEVRFFIAPEGARDFAFQVGVEDLLIGFGDDAGVSGDFEAALINQGSGAVQVSARFFDEAGQVYGIERTGETQAIAHLPTQTRMVIDIEGGRAPYTASLQVNGGSAQNGRLFNINLGSDAAQTLAIAVTDATAGTPISASLTITAQRLSPQPTLPTPGDPPATVLPATLATDPTDTPRIVIASQNDREVLLTTQPADATLRWQIVGEPGESSPQPSFAVAIAPGEMKMVRVRRPGTSVPPSVDFYFYFDEPDDVPLADEDNRLRQYGLGTGNVSSARARSRLRADGREAGAQPPLQAYGAYFDLASPLSALTVTGEASYEGIPGKRDYNYWLARRRAITVRELLEAAYPGKNFAIAIDPEPPNPADYGDLANWTTRWQSHGAPNDREWWKATVTLPPGLNQPEQQAEGVLSRPTAPTPDPIIPVRDEPPSPPRAPDWFRSLKLKVRIVRDTLVAGEIEGEIDIQTATESRLSASGELSGNAPPDIRTLESGSPLAPSNPADGITKLRLLAQSDNATGRITTLIQVGANPADIDGLVCGGWLPGEIPPANKDFGLTLLGSYISFWPLLVTVSDGNQGRIEDAVLLGGALALPGVVAALPWFQVERVILFGVEYLQRDRQGELEAFLLFDVEADWSVRISLGDTVLIEIERDHPLAVRYKAIGLRLGNRADDGSEQFSLRPVFDASRGYTIDVARNGSLKVAEPFDQILRVLAARISRTNPMTFEVDVGMAVDLGVVSVERARVRVYLDEPRAPELTALAAGIDIPGAIAGKGYLEIGDGVIGGQIDLTIRPVNLRVAAAIEIAQISEEDGGPATGVYVGLNIILPVGIPLGQSGLGIFGFRGIFGMHYQRNPLIGEGTGVPALAWLEAAAGQPHLLSNGGVRLWTPEIDRWAFGLGILIGTMEGGVIMNLDGTFLLELPGPRILIVLNARVLVPPPSLDALGVSGGILAVIEITPEHFLIGILIEYSIERLLTLRIPIEAVFSFTDPNKWHIYLGQRADYGDPIEVNVLDLVKGTGYLMFKGDGLVAYKRLPEVPGFAIGLGAGASLVFGDVDIGLYLRIGGSMDAVIGFDPFLLGGELEVSGELRLFIISIGAHASLLVLVRETSGGSLLTYIHGEACGRVDFFFFSVEGCVTIEIGDQTEKPPLPSLVTKLSIKSRSPALVQGTGVDRPVDASLGDGLESDSQPNGSSLADLLTVPIDAIPILSMVMPPKADDLTFLGTPVSGSSGLPASGYVPRGAEEYQYELESVELDRITPAGPGAIGTVTPATWWILNDPSEPNPVAQLALLTWEPTPASKAIEKSEVLKESIKRRWGRVCDQAAPPTAILWTFRFERLGASATGWDLEGIAWPDPPDTKRSSPPNTDLRVTERWRSGDAHLDAVRGIVPAIVTGGTIQCQPPDDPPQPPPADPVFPPFPIENPDLINPVPINPVPVNPVPIRPLPVNPNPDLIPPTPVPRPPVPIRPGLNPVMRPEIGTGRSPQVVIGGQGAVSLRATPTTGQALGAADPVLAQLTHRPAQQPFRITQRLYNKVMQSGAIAPSPGGSLPEAPLTLDGAINQLQRSGSVSRQDLIQASLLNQGTSQPATQRQAIPTTQRPTGRLCFVRVLESPIFDDGRPIVFGNSQKTKEVAVRLEQAGVTHGPLDDVVVLHTGAFKETKLLLLVPRVLLFGRLVVRTLDAEGRELGRVLPSPSDWVPAQKPLPPRWADFNGPWADDIADILLWADTTAAVKGYLPVLVTVGGEEAGDRIEIGVLPDRKQANQQQRTLAPAYYLAAIESLRQSEILRQEWDETQITREREVLTSVLGPASTENALLYPGSLYRLTARWNGHRKGDGTTGDGTQVFWFQTDNVPPPRLDAWMLMTLPADGEQGVFGAEPIRLVFNTHDVDRLYGAYGKELRIRLQASSAHHPTPKPLMPHPFPINGFTLEPAGAALLSPWEAALEEVLEGSCIPIDQSRTRQSTVTVPIPLDPYTDYILDVEMVDGGAAATATGPSVYRRHFSTGAYGTLTEFAIALKGVRVSHRSVPVGSMAAIRTFFAGRDPQGAELDEQFRANGLEAMPTPDRPRVLVFWEQAGGLPQPTAILVDADEPMWRSRPYPTLITDDTSDIPTERWVLQDKPWLSLLPTPGGAAIIAPNGLIRAPGYQRSLVVLAPNSRNQRLRLDLVEHAFPEPYLNRPEQRITVIDITANRAPWEE